MAAKSIEERLQRVEDFQQVQNIMGRYAYYVMASRHDDINEMFAKRDPGTRVTWGTAGYWEGTDATKRATEALHGMGGPRSREGIMALHLPICPVIEVAGDGKTARGVWCSPGLLCMKNGETGEVRGVWEWDKYGVDFIKEDGQWRIWHHHIYSLLHWDVDEGFKAAYTTKPPLEEGGGRVDTMDGGPYDNNPYSPDTVQELLPKPPEPYETFDPNERY